MPRPSLALPRYRVLVRTSLLLAVAATVAGLYAFLQGAWPLGLVGVGAGVLLLVPSQWAQIRPDPSSATLLVLVTKRQCSLCDEARALLADLTAGTPFRIEEAALESHRFLRRHFKDDVPVLLWQGEVLARLAWDPEALRRRLEEIRVHTLPDASTNGRQSP